MSKDWTNQLRDQLADYQVPAQDDLWAKIEQSLAHHAELNQAGNTVETKQAAKPSHLVSIQRLSMAAAIAALAIGGTYIYLNPWDHVQTEQVSAVFQGHGMAESGRIASNKMSSDTKFSSDGKIPFDSKVSSGNKFSSGSMLLQKNSRVKISGHLLLSQAQVQAADSHIPAMSSEIADNKPSTRTFSSLTSNSNGGEITAENYVEGQDASGSLGNAIQERGNKRRKGHGWTMQVYGSNGVAANSPMNTDRAFVMSDASSYDPVFFNDGTTPPKEIFESKALFSLRNFDLNHEEKHHQPISAGLQVGYALTPRLQLATGLVYTYVSSEFIGGNYGGGYETTQKLHYLGIPLTLNYHVWGTKQVHTYVTLGGEGAVNIKNHTVSDGVEQNCKRDRMQWSANASAGIQYDMIPQLGIYLEPGVKYYFDNGSEIQNAFKDKKVNFNLQLGLRMNLGKK